MNIKRITFFYCLLIFQGTEALSLTDKDRTQHSIGITHTKTSSIVFPSAIISVDRGSKDVMVQKAKGVDNVLQLKAARSHFVETNLTVITSDGNIHQFTVFYSDHPSDFLLEIQGIDSSKQVQLIFLSALTEAEMSQQAAVILQSKKSMWFKKSRHQKISISVRGLYAKNGVMFIHVRTENDSNIDYDIESLRFYIRDKSRLKRTALQENEVKPIFTNGNDRFIQGESGNDIVYAVEKFTIPDAKLFEVEMMEHHGGRHVSLRLKNRTIIKANSLH